MRNQGTYQVSILSIKYGSFSQQVFYEFTWLENRGPG